MLPRIFRTTLLFLAITFSTAVVFAEEPSEDATVEDEDADTNSDSEADPEESAEVDEPDAKPLFTDDTETLADQDDGAASLPGRVDLSTNFSTLRLVGDALALGAGGTLILLDGDVLGVEFASMGAPTRASIDYDVSIGFHGDLQEGGKFLGGSSTILGYTLILGPAAFYGLSAGWVALQSETLLDSQTINIDHKFWGYFETMAWTALTTGLLKSLVGRDRPYRAFARDGYGDIEETGYQGGFPSAFAAFSFASASYLARDLSNHLSDTGSGFLVASVMPYGLLYGTAALVSAGRIFEQQAFLSDVLVGATLGSLVGHLVYSTHFDSNGAPAEGDPSAEHARFDIGPDLIPTNNSVTMGLGVRGLW